MPFDLTIEEREALSRNLREHLSRHRFPLSPSLQPLKSALCKLEPPEQSPTPYPPVGNRYPFPAARQKRRR